MSEDHQHETPIKTPKQLIVVIVLSFVIPIALILLLVGYVTGGKKVDEQGLALKPEAIAERIKPVAAVSVKAADGPKVHLSGEQVYAQACKACHEAGVANAPKFGDAASWAPRLKTGYDELVKNSINGIRGMPPRGGNGDLSDYEMARGMVYMANAAGGTFKEPAAPAAAATADAKAAAPVAGPAAAATASAAFPAKVLFAAGKAAIDSAGNKSIADAADYLKANAGAKVNLSGYVDSSGNAAKNAELAKQRAFAVRDALKQAGVAEDRIALKKPEEIKGGNAADARRVEISLADSAAATVAATPAPSPAATLVASAAPAKADAGRGLYDTACMACHAAGVANAPKLGDKDAWAPRIKSGMNTLYASVINGKGAMPPKGTAMNSSEADIKAAVDYMVGSVK